MNHNLFGNKKNGLLNEILIDKSPMGIIVVEKKGIIKFVNPYLCKILDSANTIG